MLLAAMQLAAENAHRVTASRMKRVEDLHLKSQTPGIMALARAQPASRISRRRSARRSSTPAGASSSPAPPISCRSCRRRGVT
jgi:hypothetical protein